MNLKAGITEIVLPFDSMVSSLSRDTANALSSMSMNRKVAISYDRDADVMYLSFDDAKAEADEIEDGVLARYDHKTGRLPGFTIINFSRKFARKPREILIPART